MREGVTWNVVLSGHGFAGKLAAGIQWKIGGASVVWTEYAGPGEVGFSGDDPGTIRAVEPRGRCRDARARDRAQLR